MCDGRGYIMETCDKCEGEGEIEISCPYCQSQYLDL
jgi:DnaJ-class molecular chaperone